MSKSSYRRLGGGDKYDDDPARHYSWDSTVPNFRNVKAGDAIVLWDEVQSIGASVIERITEADDIKRRGRCPSCNTTNYEPRKSLLPVYRCGDCKAVFDDPLFEDVEVRTYRSTHEQAWVDLGGVFTAKELRELCVEPKAQNSFRPLRWDAFRTAAAATMGGDYLLPIDATTAQIRGGHAVRPTRVRLGQSAFRKALLRSQGPRCAFTGDHPEAVLDACHLYSYAQLGKHHEHGGVLLRRDLHTLFDRGIIAVGPQDTIDVSEDFRKYPTYGELQGRPLSIAVNDEKRTWFALHWALHRGSGGARL